MRTATKGLYTTSSGEYLVNKIHRGERIYKRLGLISLEQAQAWLADELRLVNARLADPLSLGRNPHFRDASARYLRECAQRQLRSLDTISYHVRQLNKAVGASRLADVCNASFETFIARRRAEGASSATISHSLATARAILTRAHSLWKYDGKPILSNLPLIEHLPERRRLARSLLRDEAARLLSELPTLNRAMVTFALNTGARDQNVCGLRWSWEVHIPTLKRSVFVIPPPEHKNGRAHLLLLNDAAWAVIEAQRGAHVEFVFAWCREAKHADPSRAHGRRPVETMHNTAFQNARKRAGVPDLRVQDLRHTFAVRVLAAGATEEERLMLMGHCVRSIAQHYARGHLARLLELTNKIINMDDFVTVHQVLAVTQRGATSWPNARSATCWTDNSPMHEDLVANQDLLGTSHA